MKFGDIIIDYVAIYCHCDLPKKIPLEVHPGGHGHTCHNCSKVYNLKISINGRGNVIVVVYEDIDV